MICIKCYQEIPDGSKFCPHCGAQQPDTAVADHADTQANTTAQPDAAAQQNTAAQADTAAQQDTAAQADTAVQADTAAQADTAVQADTAAQQDTQYQNQNTQYQDPYAQYQGAQNYGSGYQNTYTSDHQNAQYQTPPVYQSSYETEKPANWVPYLVLSIVSLVCCCGGFPFAIVAIVYSVKINNATTAGNHEEARKAAKLARIWIIVAFVVGIIVNIIYALLYVQAFGSYYYYY